MVNHAIDEISVYVHSAPAMLYFMTGMPSVRSSSTWEERRHRQLVFDNDINKFIELSLCIIILGNCVTRTERRNIRGSGEDGNNCGCMGGGCQGFHYGVNILRRQHCRGKLCARYLSTMSTMGLKVIARTNFRPIIQNSTPNVVIPAVLIVGHGLNLHR